MLSQKFIFSLLCTGFVSGTKSSPANPATLTLAPITIKNAGQPSREERILPVPATINIANNGNTFSTPSMVPRLVSSLVSVTQALKEASLASDPQKDMMQSMTITIVTVIASTFAVDIPGKSAAVCSLEINANNAVMMPQTTYPIQRKYRRCPMRSEMMPPTSVAMVDTAALQATIAAMSPALPPILLNRNRLNSMFSTAQASWPIRPNTMMVSHCCHDNFVFIHSILCPQYSLFSTKKQKLKALEEVILPCSE